MNIHTQDLHGKFPTSTRSLLWTLLIVNLVLRVVWLIYMHPPQLADFEWYFTHSAQMAAGQGYVWNGHHTAYWPIGWPFILAALFRITGVHLMAGLILNTFFSIGIVFLIYLTGVQVFHRRDVAFAAALGYTLLPSQVQWNAVLGSEESFTLLLMAALYLYAKAESLPWRRWLPWGIAGGVLLGLSCDVRPLPLLFPIALLLYERIVGNKSWGRAVGQASVFGVSMLAAVAPVTVRNRIAMGHWILVSTNGGVNLWQGTKTNGGYYWSWLPWRNPLLKANGNEILQNQIGEHVATQYILHHPMEVLKNGLIKIFDLYKIDTNAIWYTIHVTLPNSALFHIMNWFDTGVYWAFMGLAVVGLVKVFRGGWTSIQDNGLYLVFVLYYTAIFLFFPAWDRFRYPIMPIYALWLGVGVMVLVHHWRKSGP